MRRFNLEKELYKIQHRNKNKIIFSVITLLLIIAIGSSYALYQIRYSKQIIYTKVGPFNKRDVYLAVKVNGEYSDKFPDQNSNYAFNGYECDGKATVTFDPDKWIASVNATGPDKCTIKFGPKNINYDKLVKDDEVIVDETNDVNLRYIGADPNNYIWFNCDDYNFTTAEEAVSKNCEKWRIIGLMNNMTIVDEATGEEINNQSLVKLIRITTISESIQWDSEGTNNWETASLQKSLNGPYYNGEILNGDKGITPATQEFIEQVTWNLGGWDANITTLEFYDKERGVTTYNVSRPTTWNGKIALMYPSDYGYATSGGSAYNRQQCLDTILYNWYEDGYKEECAENSWLLNDRYQWTLMPDSSRLDNAFVIRPNGQLAMTIDGVAKNRYWARPTLFLKTSIKIKNEAGDGSVNKPYILIPGE